MMKKYKYVLLWSIILVVYLLGWRIDLMDVDAAQYASISKEMAHSGSFLQIYDLGRDYLDKPPLLFWTTAAMMFIFGDSDLIYRFVNLLFLALAIYSTYRFAKKYYAPPIPYYAAIILATSQAAFLITHDCRTDTMLMGWVMFATWMFSVAIQKKEFKYYAYAFAAVAAGMLTKGPIAAAVLIFAFGGYFIYRKKWQHLFKWQYLAGLGIIAAALLPMCIGLYLQFDQHPEKVLYGHSGNSGLKFFFWTQSFGRITGESTWSEHGNFFFLLQNMLWSFAPWILFLVVGWWLLLKRVWYRTSVEEISFFGFTLTYIALALSRYQLPHYIFVVFPFAAIIAAVTIHEIRKKIRIENSTKFTRIYTLFYNFNFASVFLLWSVIPLIHFYVFPLNYQMMVALALLITLITVTLRSISLPTAISFGIVTILTVNILLSTWFYPQLLQYQLGSSLGKYLKQEKRSAQDFFTYHFDVSHSFVFYSNILPKSIIDLDALNVGNWVLADQAGLTELENKGLQFKIIKSGDHTAVTTLSFEWLNKATRAANCQHYFVVEVTGKIRNS